jgi:hypothetical protein
MMLFRSKVDVLMIINEIKSTFFKVGWSCLFLTIRDDECYVGCRGPKHSWERIRRR